MGGQINIGGLHRPPFLFLPPVASLADLRKFPGYDWDWPIDHFDAKKSERPVGVPAARAWGMEGLLSEDQSFSGVAGCSTALASRRTTHRSKIVRIIPPLPIPNRTPDHVNDSAGDPGVGH